MQLPVRIIHLRQGRHLLWLLRNQSLCHCTPLLESRGDALYRHWPRLSASARAGTYLWLLTNLYPYRRTSLLKSRGDALYRHWPRLSASAKTSTCSGCSPTYTLTATPRP